MAAQKGRDLLIKIADDNGALITLAGLRTKSLSLNARLVDITDSGSAQAWRELLPGAGVKTIDVSGSGIFRDSASDALARTAFFDQAIRDFEIIIPDFGIIAGDFLISRLNYAGTYAGEASYDISLSSAGPAQFTAI
ncbi:MAG: phage major tail protein, TP901-1 family [Robiginitomaculum sp.]